MKRACVLLAPGFEEIEAVTVIDVLRRAGVEVDVAAVMAPALEAAPFVTGSHDISVRAARRVETVSADDYDVLVLPGGLPGAHNLRDDDAVQALIVSAHHKGKLVAAICAGPVALERAGVLAGRAATSYPGNALPSARYSEARVVVDGQVVTSRGPGTALEFALTLVRLLVSEAASEKLASGMMVSAG
jgi:4-methyl-5(b-hydroxyethyl)-thiazole monophosphate biosynthesis